MSDIFAASDPALSRMTAIDGALTRAKQGFSNKKIDDLRMIEESAKEFEALFVSEMLRPMFEGIGSDPLFGGGQGEETWRSLMIDEYGKQIVKTGGIGISDSIKSKMIEMQAAFDGVPPSRPTPTQVYPVTPNNSGEF